MTTKCQALLHEANKLVLYLQYQVGLKKLAWTQQTMHTYLTNHKYRLSNTVSCKSFAANVLLTKGGLLVTE